MEKSLDEVIREIENKLSIKDIKFVSENLTNKYLSSFSGGIPLATKKTEILAYIVTRMRATYEASKYVIDKISFADIKTCLDLGSGTGAATVALLETFGDAKIDVVEKSNEMLNMNKQITESMFGDEVKNKISYFNEDATKFNTEKDYDLIIASYFFNELTKEARLKLVEKLYLKAGRYFVVIEPGTPQNHAEMMEIREVLEDKLGAKLQGPCKLKKCPYIKTSDWCHFLTRVRRSKVEMMLKNAELGYEDEKFTYLIYSKENGVECKENIVIRRPEIKKGNIKIKVCSTDGIHFKTYTKNNKEAYKLAKKLEVGSEFNKL